MTMDSAEHFYAKDRQAWHDWLEENHLSKPAVWLVYDKGDKRTMSWGDIVDEALCFGWIDSRPGKVSATQSKLYITKRKPKSVWSKINKEKIDNLIRTNKMQPAGMQSVENAKQNGSWDTLNNSDNLIVPPEMQKMFQNNLVAQDNFDKFSNSSRRNILQWIYDAKTTDTRIKRIQTTINLAEQNQKSR